MLVQSFFLLVMIQLRYVFSYNGDFTIEKWDSAREKGPSVFIKNDIKFCSYKTDITSERLALSTCYFHHLIRHHFSMVKCILESWTISVPTFLRAIPPGVQNYHIFV